MEVISIAIFNIKFKQPNGIAEAIKRSKSFFTSTNSILLGDILFFGNNLDKIILKAINLQKVLYLHIK